MLNNVLIRIIFTLFTCLLATNCFNFDIKLPIYKKIDFPNASFGLSVTQFRAKTQNFLIVGAPKADFGNYKKSGAVYKCPITLGSTDDCTPINVDFEPVKNSDEFDTNSGQSYDSILKGQFKWRIINGSNFGISLASSSSGYFVACANMYAHYYNFTTFDAHTTYGACFMFNNNFQQEYKYVPCLKYSHLLNKFEFNMAYCQAGTGLHMTDAKGLLSSETNNIWMSMGLPSALNFRGLAVVEEINKREPQYTVEYIHKNNSKLCSYEIELAKEVPKNPCASLSPTFSYLGMSTLLLMTNFKNVQNKHVLVVGAPRENVTGRVRFTNLYTDFGDGSYRFQTNDIFGDSKFSYFGATLATIDVNKDGINDLIVGAPHYNEKNEADKGAIYVYYGEIVQVTTNKAEYRINKNVVFKYVGVVNSQFGSSIAPIGDIDNDGYQDFAVGAPYELDVATNSTGAVYIFRTGPNKMIKLSQKISAADLKMNAKKLNAFGYSISGGMDMDGNGYPDLAIGSYQSNMVFLIRTYPVVNISVTVSNLDRLQEIDSNCRNAKSANPCFQIELCFDLPTKPASLGQLPLLNYQLKADPAKSFSRVSFSQNTASSVQTGSVDVNSRNCERIGVYLRKDMADYITPIEFNLTYNFNQSIKDGDQQTLADINKYPIVHQDFNSTKFEVNFKKECSDISCKTDLILQADIENLKFEDDTYLISLNESEFIYVNVSLENTLENAYGTQVIVKFDDRLDYSQVEKLSEYGYKCSLGNKLENQSILECSMSSGNYNPFPKQTKIEFKIKFSAVRLTRNALNRNVFINLYAKTLSRDTNLENNNVTIKSKLIIRVNLMLYGSVTPEQVFYDTRVRGESAMRSLDDIGPIIEHTYKISNLGPFSVYSFDIDFYWPYETILHNNYGSDEKVGKHLLYLISDPLKIPNNHEVDVNCDKTYEVDPLKIRPTPSSFRYRRSNDGHQQSQRAVIDCFSNTAYCYKIRCAFRGELIKDISIKFIAYLWNSTLSEDFSQYERVLIKSHAEILLNDEVNYDDSRQNNEFSLMTVADSQITKISRKPISKWIIVGSVFGGLFLLAICIVAFYMMGFFERKRLKDDTKGYSYDEAQTLKNDNN